MSSSVSIKLKYPGICSTRPEASGSGTWDKNKAPIHEQAAEGIGKLGCSDFKLGGWRPDSDWDRKRANNVFQIVVAGGVEATRGQMWQGAVHSIGHPARWKNSGEHKIHAAAS
ncbi:hypothetical protein EMPG_09904 [Blastomyces silverae]|uniref:Uncharacterized protein n=1 Tax=Blastomyces silverae TaxID=2060906 RepID=A0A0H1BGD2_9EURO|nr:hypothetical protein EMPG_09904 [Blastomyces silverae]